jgi:hypothetical protein
MTTTDQKPSSPRPPNVNDRRRASGMPYADIPPITQASAEGEPAADRLQFPDRNGETRKITLSTTVQHRGRTITITATDMKLDTFCDLLDAAGYTAPAPAQWHTLPDGTPLCPKHSTPMKLRNKQGDEWYSHRVFSPEGEELWCKGYHGKDSPGYEY